MLTLSKAFVPAAASENAKTSGNEVGFCQSIRAALSKSAPGGGKSKAERELVIQQLG